MPWEEASPGNTMRKKSIANEVKDVKRNSECSESVNAKVLIGFSVSISEIFEDMSVLSNHWNPVRVSAWYQRSF